MSYSSSIERLASKPWDDHPEVVKYRINKVLHDRFTRGLDQIAERVQYGSTSSITAVIGPTGAGKSALKDEFTFQFDRATRNLPRDKCPAVLSIDLQAPERGPFNWRDDFYKPALVAMNEPCVDLKIDLELLRHKARDGDTKPLFGRSHQTIPQFREQFRSALERCRVIAVFIDEAGHMRRPTSKNGVFTQYDSLKSRSDGTKSHFVLLGTIELADIFSQSGQISRRVFPIWMSPYSLNERAAFLGGLEAIQQKLDRPMAFSLGDKVEEILMHVYGSFGLVHDWIDRALVKTIEQNAKNITWAMLSENRYHPVQLAGIAKEVDRYYALQSEFKESLNAHTKSIFDIGSGAPRSRDRGNVKPNLRPGERKPTRDPVGE
jgi:hypothetical protein